MMWPPLAIRSPQIGLNITFFWIMRVPDTFAVLRALPEPAKTLQESQVGSPSIWRQIMFCHLIARHDLVELLIILFIDSIISPIGQVSDYRLWLCPISAAK
jgi:hypothetical protein